MDDKQMISAGLAGSPDPSKSLVISKLTNLVLSDQSTDFIEKQKKINEFSLELHHQQQTDTALLHHRIHFLTRIIMVGAHYVKKMQETVVILKKDQVQLSERVEKHDSEVNQLNHNIDQLRDQMTNELGRIEKLEASFRIANISKYLLYVIISYLILRRKYKSLGSLAAFYGLLNQKDLIVNSLKDKILKYYI
eukprot:NODE_2_length_91304_cov_0.692462.p50 type:complete len:193 gc:universal NODE_2_length_91304_cov_0.692462:81856-82434(+)